MALPTLTLRTVDLSGIIFVVLAIGWAGYLLPKALKHHDDQAMSRPVETFSDSVRVVGAPKSTPKSTQKTRPEAEPVETRGATSGETPAVPVRRHLVTREAARRAARRRRRVLAVLLLALGTVSVTSYLAYTPWWSTAVPGGLILAFLVVARLTVRAQARHARHVPVQVPAEAVETVTPSRAAAPAEVEPDLGREDTQGLSREQLAEAVASPVLDDGGLWDPLPVTLPTYVNKARARRTVRTIEITGITSSGHDAADSELARSADENTEVAETEDEQRKAAGA